MNRLALIIVIMAVAMTGHDAAQAAGWIRINQLGYLPGATKVAVLMSEDKVAVSEFELVDAYTGKTAYRSAKATGKRPLGQMQSAWRLDFSDFNVEGAYRIVAAGVQSPVFPINNHVWDGTADFVLNYMRQQRCGFNPFQRDSCHVKDAYVRYHPDKEGQRIDVTGGWHDAADLLQYTTTSANAIYQMMLAWQECPGAFGDQYQANGLEGANGIPDIIDEIYWGLTWLDKMNPGKGELYNQIADDRDHIGMKLPKDDPADYGWGPNNGRPVYYIDGKPQQRGKYMNATMGAASTAGKFASDFALGSQVLAPYYPEFAARIGAKAADAYQMGIDKPGNAQTVSVVSPYIYEEDNWVDDMELGAIELYRMTGEDRYLTQAVEYGRREPVTPWMGADSARHYQWYPFMNMGHVRVVQQAEGKDARLRAEFIRNIKAGIERVQQRAEESDSPFLWGVPGIWCSNNLTTALLTQCILYRQLTGDRQFMEMEAALRDWLLGCNPWGTSMIVELPRGGTYPHAPHSNYVMERVGMPTGGLVDGPVYATIFNSLKGVNLADDMLNIEGNTYDLFQPGDVVFHDNTHDYSTNEPTMDGTASLTFPFSFYEMEGKASSGRFLWDEGAIVRGDASKKQITLVFTADDRADGAERIITTLKQQGVKGAFFFTGRFFDLYPDVVSRLVADGHYVGSHSYGHLLYCDWQKRDSLLIDKEQFSDDIVKSYAAMARFGITPQSAPWMIPPYEWHNATVAAWAREMGLQLINFSPGTASSMDYTWPGIEGGNSYRDNKWLWDRIMRCERENTLNGQLLMMHLGTDERRVEKFYDRLPALIKALKKKGYQFVSLPAMME
ncbi:MAG: glycoside hydrolase family 9 protein [Muribaculaceae bacterium]|nr:glycoside hydrolase family 9 protein [Muribaculaceae bacterium]